MLKTLTVSMLRCFREAGGMNVYGHEGVGGLAGGQDNCRGSLTAQCSIDLILGCAVGRVDEPHFCFTTNNRKI